MQVTLLAQTSARGSWAQRTRVKYTRTRCSCTGLDLPREMRSEHLEGSAGAGAQRQPHVQATLSFQQVAVRAHSGVNLSSVSGSKRAERPAILST